MNKRSIRIANSQLDFNLTKEERAPLYGVKSYSKTLLLDAIPCRVQAEGSWMPTIIKKL